MAYYGAGVAASLAMGAMPGARAARAPVLALLAANWGAEQWALAALQSHLEVDQSTGEVYADITEPLPLAAARQWLLHAARRLRRASARQPAQISIAEVIFCPSIMP